MIMYLNKRIIFGWLLLGGLFAGACGEDEPAPAAEPLDLSIRAALAPVLTADGTASVEECRMEWSADDAFGLWGRSSRFADNNVCFTLQEVSADGEVSFPVRCLTLPVWGLRRCVRYIFIGITADSTLPIFRSSSLRLRFSPAGSAM